MLRALVLLLLVAAAASPALWRAPSEAAPSTVWLQPGEPVAQRVLQAGGAVVRDSPEPPTAAELEELAAAAGAAPLFAALPPRGPLVAPLPPERIRVGRRAALHIRVFGEPGDSVLLRLGEANLGLDSVSVELDANGTGAAGFAVRPARAGWQEWWVSAGAQRETVGAWVAEASPPRVLLVAGEVGWESAFVGRSLEESGVRVERVQPLGAGMVVRDGLAALPTSAAGLEGFDAVVLLGSIDVGAQQALALAAYLGTGGGVIVAGRSTGAVLPGAAARDGRTVAASAIRWRTPAELAPLPDASLESAATTLHALPAGSIVAADAGDAALLALAAYGRGRLADLGIAETWRWRMEAGRIEEHREFWRGLIDWAADGAREATVLRLASSHVATGAAVEVEVLPADGGIAPERAAAVTVTRPDGTTDALPLSPGGQAGGLLRARLVPQSAGVYRLDGPGAAPVAFVASDDRLQAADGWARLALLAEASGGAAVPATELAARVRRWETARGVAGGRGWPWALLLFVGVLGLASAEWALRRWRGLR